jgi:hypothetical protein
VLNWNDADDNNAFHSKLMVMDFDGTISTEVALYNKERRIRRHRDPRPAARQRRQGAARAGHDIRADDPKRREKRRAGKGVLAATITLSICGGNWLA